MRELDETDLGILRLLVADARRPYSDIAKQVDVSPPTVSDRVERLEELGVIERFTLDIDQSKLNDGVSVLIDIDLKPGAVRGIKHSLAEAEQVEHVFSTADASVVVQATVRQDEVQAMLADAIEMEKVIDYDVRLLADSQWSPQIDGAEFAPDCDECGNTVDNEGESVRIDGQLHHFCCSSCRSNFQNRYERLKESA
ncbi:AsnC family transcriptional regulator [Halostella sp. PRR32]|uniref:AsnC family transcriptional regulator n=1 Tax=Halostella sp. PRR32 TaxID=3098147 RepID=UPI002B1DA79F|nr:AsnC family transcriptional regulator [Halostella sp. PRR32]